VKPYRIEYQQKGEYRVIGPDMLSPRSYDKETAEQMAELANQWASLRSALAAEKEAREKAERERDSMWAQLPVGMKHCSIVFMNCHLGHGWLTAKNWTETGCPTCRAEAAESEVAALKVERDKWKGMAVKFKDRMLAAESEVSALKAQVSKLREALGDFQCAVEDAEDGDCESPTCGHGRVCGNCQFIGSWFNRFSEVLSPASPAPSSKGCQECGGDGEIDIAPEDFGGMTEERTVPCPKCQPAPKEKP
jgi:hypothetical protein